MILGVSSVKHATVGIAALWLVCGSAAPAEEPSQGPEVLRWEQLPPLPDPEGFAGAYVGVSKDGGLPRRDALKSQGVLIVA